MYSHVCDILNNRIKTLVQWLAWQNLSRLLQESSQQILGILHDQFLTCLSAAKNQLDKYFIWHDI